MFSNASTKQTTQSQSCELLLLFEESVVTPSFPRRRARQTIINAINAMKNITAPPTDPPITAASMLFVVEGELSSIIDVAGCVGGGVGAKWGNGRRQSSEKESYPVRGNTELKSKSNNNEVPKQHLQSALRCRSAVRTASAAASAAKSAVFYFVRSFVTRATIGG